MNWGVEPTEPELAVPISRRTGGRVRIEWRGQGSLQEALIEHHDKRLWRCQTGDFNTDVDEFRHYRFCGRLLSAGCQPLRMVGKSLPAIRQLVERFANMPQSIYMILVVDAESTSTHPLAGSIVQVTIRKEVRRQRGFLPTDYQVEVQEETRVGRIDGPNITLFPSLDEVMTALDDLRSLDARFIAPAVQAMPPPVMSSTHRTTMTPRRTELSAAAAAVEASIPPERSNRSIRL